MPSFDTKFKSGGSEFNAKFKSGESDFRSGFNATGKANWLTDHQALYNRDVPDAHPIMAISNLEEELNARPNLAITNSEIEEILAR